jgi:hypothetical protein
MKLLLENWRKFVKQEVEKLLPHGEVRAVKKIGSSTLSPEEQAEQDLEKYGYVRDEEDRDFDIEVQIAGVSNEDVEEWRSLKTFITTMFSYELLKIGEST